MGNELTEVLKDKTLPGLPTRFQPTNLTELMAWAKLIEASQLAPKGMNQAAVVLSVQMGAELNITPTQALQNIAVINGRPSIWGDLGLALFRRDAKFKSFTERSPQEALAAKEGYCRIEMADGTVVERTFSEADAQAAGLLSKPGPWQQYRGRMYMYRARWWCMRDAAPEVFKGLSAAEEQDDVVDAEVTAVDGVPRRASGIDPAEVDKFVDGQGRGPAPARASAAATADAPRGAGVDRAKLEKVLIGEARGPLGGDKKFYAIMIERSSGGPREATTFDSAIFETAKGLKGKFGLAALRKNPGKTIDPATKKPKVYLNIDHLEADAPVTQDPPPPVEQGEPGELG